MYMASFHQGIQLFYLAGLPVAGFFQQKKQVETLTPGQSPGSNPLTPGVRHPEIFAIQIQVMSYGQKILSIISEWVFIRFHALPAWFSSAISCSFIKNKKTQRISRLICESVHPTAQQRTSLLLHSGRKPSVIFFWENPSGNNFHRRKQTKTHKTPWSGWLLRPKPW